MRKRAGEAVSALLTDPMGRSGRRVHDQLATQVTVVADHDPGERFIAADEVHALWPGKRFPSKA
jgi:hypothetical protein